MRSFLHSNSQCKRRVLRVGFVIGDLEMHKQSSVFVSSYIFRLSLYCLVSLVHICVGSTSRKLVA